MFAAGVSTWIPERVTAGLVAILFTVFGIHALRTKNEDSSEEVVESSGHSISFTTLLLIFVAEFGDKTQISVAGLASSMTPFPVWLGATIALVLVSVLGALFGRTVLQRYPLMWLHRLSGVIFISFGLLAAWHALTI